jgi:hypothetical protein
MLKELTDWLFSLVTSALLALLDVLKDAFVWLVDVVVGAVVAVAALIPVPQFMSNGLQWLFGQLDGPVSYLVGVAGLPEALAIIGAGYLFRLGRKAATLFQW